MSARIYERYRVIAIAHEGFPVREIADRSGLFVTSISDRIEYFDAHEFDGFDDSVNPDGRLSSLTSAQLQGMVKIAFSRRTDLGLLYTQWRSRNSLRFC